MKITLLNSALFCGALLLFPCENSKGGKTGSTNSDLQTATCLEKFNYDYSKLLTKKDVLKNVSIDDPAAIKVVYDAASVEKRPEYGDIYYKWPSDRPDVPLTPSSPVDQPDLNSINLSNLSFEEGDAADILDSFHAAYGNMSQEQLDATIARMEEFYKDKPAADLENAKKNIQRRAKSNNTPVDGVGDAAYWFPVHTMGKYYGAKVVALTGNAQFSVLAKVSTNDEKNFEVAKKMALEVLAKCK